LRSAVKTADRYCGHMLLPRHLNGSSSASTSDDAAPGISGQPGNLIGRAVYQEPARRRKQHLIAWPGNLRGHDGSRQGALGRVDRERTLAAAPLNRILG